MRSIWKGSIGFGLVNIPIKLYSAVQSSSIDLDMLDERDHARIRFQRINETTRKEVPYDKIVRAYKYHDDYVVLDDEDFAAASPEKSRIIEIESFVDLKDVNPMYFETSYYAEPDAQSKAYALLLHVLKTSGKAGVGRFVLRSSESLCIIHPVKNCLVVTRIRFAQEIRSMEDLKLPDESKLGKRELDMGMALIKEYTEKFDVSKFKNEYTNELMKIIEAKAKGKAPKIKKLKIAKTSSDDLYDQLMASLSARKGA